MKKQSPRWTRAAAFAFLLLFLVDIANSVDGITLLDGIAMVVALAGFVILWREATKLSRAAKESHGDDD